MKWVQVKDNVYLTVTVCDLENVKIEFDATHMSFRYFAFGSFHCSANQKEVNYAVNLEFFGEIIPEVTAGVILHCRNVYGLKMASAL